MKFNDESEIDEWFQNKKELLDQELYDKVLKKNSKKAHDKYNKKMRFLLKKYEDISINFIKKEEHKKKLMKPIKKLKQCWIDFKLKIKLKKKILKEKIKKKIFNIKYYFLMKK